MIQNLEQAKKKLNSIKKNCRQQWVAARLAGRWSNGHFIAIIFIWAGQASLNFCRLTFTFISLFSSGSGQDVQ